MVNGVQMAALQFAEMKTPYRHYHLSCNGGSDHAVLPCPIDA